MDMKRIVTLISVVLLLGPGSLALAMDTDLYILTNADVPPNVLIMFDNSGSMNDPITGELYSAAKGYPYVFTDQPNAVYYSPNGQAWNLYRSSVNDVVCVDVRNALLTEGFYTGKIKFQTSECGKSTQTNLRLGNYMNYVQTTGGSSTQPKLGLAKGIIQSYVNTTEGVRFGAMIFNPAIEFNGESDSRGGHMLREVRDMTAQNRSDLHSAIGGIKADTWTPLAESLYEAGLYYRGGQSYFNKDAQGRPIQYTSPVQYYCQRSYVILITDGESTKDREDLATNVGDTDGDGREPGGTNEPYYADQGSDYLDDVAKDLHDKDFSTTLKNKQNVTTYTIGFTIDSPLLRRTAEHGGGKYFFCHNAQSFIVALHQIINDILAKSTSFVAPVVPISQMERTSSGDRIYLAMFKPTAKSFWKGNIKKFGIATTNNGDIKIGSVLDFNGNLAMDADGQIKDTAQSYWSLAPDGEDVEEGGIGEVLQKRTTTRNIYTYLGSSTTLTDVSNVFDVSNGAITTTMLDLNLNDSDGRAKTINFVRGLDSYDENGNGNLSEKRDWMLGAFIHSRPVIIHYGETRTVIYVGGNDGMLHAFDDATGEELWGFVPPNLLPTLKNLKGETLEHYVDGAPKAYIGDTQKILVFGQRRGGNRYHALDITDPVSPKLLWEISPSTNGFGELGQTWSAPHIGKIKYGSEQKWVVFLGGGYDTNQDDLPTTRDDTKGRAIYVVDLLSGSLLWSYSYANNAEMASSIPGDIVRVNTDDDPDEFIDRLYVGDMGGQMWRFDIGNSNTANWTGKVVFNSNPGGSERRKIFYPPDVTLEKDISGAYYEMLLFGTGDREHPKDTTVINRIYAVKDKNPPTRLTENDLVDVTLDLLQDPGTSDAQKSTILAELAAKSGWYIKLDQNSGEKVLASPVVFYKIAYYSTFTPTFAEEADPCFIGQGKGRLYILQYTSGNAAFNLDLTNDISGEVVSRSDRSGVIGGAMPSGVIITIIRGTSVGYVGVGGGVYSPRLPSVKSLIPINWRGCI